MLFARRRKEAEGWSPFARNDGADCEAVTRHLFALRHDPDLRTELTARGRATIRARHTCAHRVDELLGIVASLSPAIHGVTA